MRTSNPYRISAKNVEYKKWGATRYVKLFVKIARILRIEKYHQMHNFFRIGDGKLITERPLIHNTLRFTNCRCARCMKGLLRSSIK